MRNQIDHFGEGGSVLGVDFFDCFHCHVRHCGYEFDVNGVEMRRDEFPLSVKSRTRTKERQQRPSEKLFSVLRNVM